MVRVITDTNVWYGISDKDILEISSQYKLCVPIIVVNELYTSRNLWKSEITFNLLKKAIKSVLDNIERIEFIHFDPFEFILKETVLDLKPRLSLIEYILDLKALVNLSYNQVKDIRPDRGDISGLTNYINDKSLEYKKLIDSDKLKFKKLNTRGYTENLILNWANDNLEMMGFDHKIPRLNKDKNELLIDTFDDVLREVSKSGKKIKDNDWIDIFNLTYVGKGDLYWTMEKSKLRHIQNSGNVNYIFERSFV
nr:hypothetical protein [uncultured Flavobacterium sp.]